MRRLLEFRRNTRRQVQFSFVDTRVFVTIPFREDLFEPRIFRKAVEDPNLNQRIWTKG